MDLKNIRDDFPQLESGCIYFDSAATALKPIPVIKEVRNYYEQVSANIERGLHRPSHLATVAYEEAHDKVLKYLNGDGELVFTKNCTEAINIVAHGIDWQPGDRIVTTYLEHNSNLLPWLNLRNRGVEVVVIRCTPSGTIDLDELKELVDDKTKLVAFTHASNVLGTILPVADITQLAKRRGAMVLIDGAQAAPHLKVDLGLIGCDFYAASGHKMLGPSGTGILYIDGNAMNRLHPAILGGGTVKDVCLERFDFAEGWERFEAGTPNIAGGIGLGAAVEYLSKIDIKKVRKHELELTGYLIDRLGENDRIKIHGPQDPAQKTGVVPFTVGGIPSHRVAIILDEIGNIAVRSGYHCAFLLTRDILKEELGTVRVSFYIYNNKSEIDELDRLVKDIIKHG